ncbi:hypothetical protein [Frondihabitans australicus]|uniref:hypothetical protein n=1 Tax=Frondihabitans australicus TaxID=386892 RepID=UPI0011C4623C|nr:hypothetical protein [Frondihabitans australicus]
MAREGRRPYNGPLKDDVYFEAVSPSPYYNFHTDSPVTQYEVRKDQVLLGVIWFSDNDDAGGFMSAAACGGRGKNASVEWNQQLRQAKAAGLGPQLAVESLVRDVDLGQHGRIDTASRRHFPDLAAAHAFAAER